MHIELNLSEIMERFNNEYVTKYQSLNSLLTAILVEIDIKNQKIKYVSAGHPAAIILKENSIVELKSTGKIIGFLKNINYKSFEFDFIKRDRLYIYTDGIFEEFNSSNIEFSEEKVQSILLLNKNNSMEDSIKIVIQELDIFLNGVVIQDDITILGIEYL